MRRFRNLLPLYAALLTPTDVRQMTGFAQNITVTITAAAQSVSFNPPHLSFSSQNIGTTSTAQTITLSNTGTVSFPLAGVAVTGAAAGDFAETNNCPTLLAVKAGCQIWVKFSPTANGTRAASAVASATGGGTYTASLTGTGTLGPAIVSAFYVATNGNDNNLGTLAAPFATLGRCQAAMRGSGTIKTCYLRAGTYKIPATLSLGSPDNGETWSYYPPDGPQKAIIDCGNMAASTSCVFSTATAIIWNGLYTRNLTNGFIFLNFQGCDNCKFLNNLIDNANSSVLYAFQTFGNNELIAGNTIQNVNGIAFLGFYTGIHNSVIRDNTVQCIGGAQAIYFAAPSGAGTRGNVVARNYITGIGQLGGPPPLCGSETNASGTGIQDNSPTGQNLFIGNTIINTQGYDIVASNTAGTTLGTGEVVSDNYLTELSDPNVTFNGNSGGVLRRNNMNANPGSGSSNMGNEQDNCPMFYHSDNLLITNNTMNGQFDVLYFSGSQNSYAFGNTGNIGTVSHPPPGGFEYAAGITFANRSRHKGCSPLLEDSIGNTIEDNSFTSTDASAKYGVYLEPYQTGQRVSYNVFYPFGSPGSAAIQDNSGGANTITNNQTSSSTAPLATAPPIADAGASQLIAQRQTVALNGSAHAMQPDGTAAATYAWVQIAGPSVTISHANAAQASFIAPSVHQATILGFRLTATTGNGATFDQVYYGIDPSL